MTRNELQDACRILRENDSFLVAGHINPDGDSLGCMCALGLALKQMGKSVTLVCPDGVPDTYKFLPGSGEVFREVPAGRAFGGAVIVDCEGLDRLGPVLASVQDCPSIIEIDHHPGGERSSGVVVIDPASASSGEIVLDLLGELEVKIGRDIAECLLTAIVTDTGSFRFSNVKPSTLRAAASLLETGVSVSKIAQRVYETRSLPSVKLLGSALSTLQTTSNGRVAYASITREQMASSEAAEAEGEGIVNYVRSVRGAQVGVLLREEVDGSTRVSLRSRDGLDISQVARMFGGGGHKAAAGCTIDRPLAEATDLVLDALRKWMGS